MTESDRNALAEFRTVTREQADDRLYSGRWSQAAYEAYRALWDIAHGYAVPALHADAAALVREYLR